MPKSKYLSKKMLDHVTAVAAYAKPATVYLALFTDIAGLINGTLTNEISGGGYVRQQMTFGAATDAGAELGQSVEFPVATADYGAVAGWALMDASTGGNILYFGEFPKYGDPAAYKAVYVGDAFKVRAGDLTITEA